MKQRVAICLILGLLAVLAGPIGADSAADARRQRQELAQQKAAAAAQLDALQATDQEMEAALAALEENLRIAEAKATAARQAAAAAQAELEAARAELEATKARITDLEQQVVDRAVEAYLSPQTDAWDDVISARDLGEIAQRQALLDSVAANDRDVLDELDAAREDLVEKEQALDAAEQKARERKAAAEGALAASRDAAAKQVALLAANQRRIDGQRAEIAALVAQDSRLAAIIREAETTSISNSGPPSASGLIWPVQGPVTSGYGPRWGRMHHGIDIGARSGVPIAAAKDGVVIYSGWMNGYGNVVVVDHGGGFTTVYAHQSRIAAGRGASVDRGEVIGYVGSTGRSTGPHLHFETRVNGSSRNPMNYLP